MQQQRRKARVSQEKRASDNDFAMSSTTVPKTEILFAHRILHFLHEKKSTKKKACSNKKIQCYSSKFIILRMIIDFFLKT